MTNPPQGEERVPPRYVRICRNPGESFYWDADSPDEPCPGDGCEDDPHDTYVLLADTPASSEGERCPTCNSTDPDEMWEQEQGETFIGGVCSDPFHDPRRKQMSEKRVEQLRDWKRRLNTLHTEMEEANGEPERGTYDDKVETLTRYAWEATLDELRKVGADPYA